MGDAVVLWDEPGDTPDNVSHIAEHGLTPEEVEDVLLDDANTEDVSRTTGRPCKFGWTKTGKHIVVVYEVIDPDVPMWYPVTAYEVEP
jgi:uncharacterized DUF497 family protein